MEIQTSRDGMMRAQSQFERASASMVDKLDSQNQDITKEIVEEKEAKYGFQMNARMSKVQDNMLGTLLDMVG